MTRWLQLYFNNSTLILAPSHFTKEKLEGLFTPPVEVLSRGVDIDDFNPGHRDKHPDDQAVRALYVGRVAPEKNLALLVDIFRRRSEVRLTVVGDGPYLEEMKQELPGAEYTGKLSGQELFSSYANSDFFVFPSRLDTFGNVVLEGMSSGLPAIVTDAMGPKEQVEEGVTGLVAGTNEDFERAVDTLATDRELRERMGTAARAYAETRSWDEVFETLLAQYGRAKELYDS